MAEGNKIIQHDDIVFFDIDENGFEIGMIFRIDARGNGVSDPGWCEIKQPSGRHRERNYKHDLEKGKMSIADDTMLFDVLKK